LDFKMVVADSGTIGGNFSHEFAVLAESGEDHIGFCDSCDYASNLELAEAKAPSPADENQTLDDLKEVPTPEKKSVKEVAEFLSVSSQQIVKTIVMDSDQGLVAGLVRGDREINPIKLKNLIGAQWIRPAEAKAITEETSIPCGFVGPVGLKLKVYADREVEALSNFVTGANKTDAHFTGVQINRDFKAERVADIRKVIEGDPCPKCSAGKYQVKRGIEVGHIFILGTKYSKSMKASFLDLNGKETLMVMGCYGVGVGRTAAAAIEQNHDEKGIIWPVPIAPFAVHIIPTNYSQEAVKEASDSAYRKLQDQNIEVLLDDRPDRMGVKLNDADLLGIPLQIIIGPKNLESGKVEVKIRKTNTSELHDFPQVLGNIPAILNGLLA
jgi:prolyl-tRNA synthetase